MQNLTAFAVSMAIVLSVPSVFAQAKQPVQKPQPPAKAVEAVQPKTTQVQPPSLQLYKSPQENAPVVGTLKEGETLTLLPNGWVRVKNLKTGVVGWVRRSELNDALMHPPLYRTTIKQKIGPDGKQGYRVIEYTGTQKLDKRQIKNMLDRMQKRQRHMMLDMDRMMYRNMQELNRFEHDFWDSDVAPFPVIHPVVIIPRRGEGAIAPKEKTSPSEAPKKASWWDKLKRKTEKTSDESKK